MDKQARNFDLLLAALLEKVLDQVMDAVVNMLETHTLSYQEKLDILLKMVLLVGCKPSKLLASMLSFCLPAIEQMSVFQYMFVQLLPCTLRTKL